MHKRFVKLVRDRIPQFVGDSTVVYEPIADHDKRLDALRRKLVEESIEYLMNPSVEELADVYTVLGALLNYDLSVKWQDLYKAAQSKRHERGEFDDGLGMYIYTTAGAAHEGEHAGDHDEETPEDYK
jgi:predicted house-cleaning noncanonical NTP pyrophosphatase (MazG superfamily)